MVLFITPKKKCTVNVAKKHHNIVKSKRKVGHFQFSVERDEQETQFLFRKKVTDETEGLNIREPMECTPRQNANSAGIETEKRCL